MNICAIIVTYGNRFHLLKRVAVACINNGISKIVIVDNGSPATNKVLLEELRDEFSSTINIVRNEKNLGSAGGYSSGLQFAKNHSGSEYFLMLDDDNLIDESSFLELKRYWFQELSSEERCNSALLALREDREYYVQFTKERNSDALLGADNSFMHYSLFSTKGKDSKLLSDNSKIITPIAPYGGLFISSELLNKIGLPMSSLFLYIDDIEFSYRITTSGGNIHIVPNSKVVDIDQSWGSRESNKNKTFSSPVLEEKESFRIYYTFRNRVFFEYNFRVKNKFCYFLNMSILLSKLFIKSIFSGKLKRMKLIFLAVFDGVRGHLGMTDRDL